MRNIRRHLKMGLMLVAAALFAQSAYPATLANDRLSLGFDDGSGGLADLTLPDGAADFVPTPASKPMLWELHFRTADGTELRFDNCHAPAPEITPIAESLTLEWAKLALGEEVGILDVKVTCELPSNSDTALLRISVDNRSARWGLWDIAFPVVQGLGQAGATDVAMGRGTWGRLFKDPAELIQGEYPSHSLPMQFILLQDGEHGLYLAAHDPEAWFKTFAIQTGAEFRVTTRVNDMGVPGNDWTSPYPFALSIYKGSWMEGCKKYRAWVTQNAPWTSKGPLTARKDVPDHIQRVCAWLLASGAPGDVALQVKQFASEIGVPVGVHWYNWHEIPFDTFYPNYFPTKPGFPEAVKELVASGVTVMPYINSRLWDTANENFQLAKPAAMKNEKGEVTIEEYGSGAKLAAMCPTQPLWQEKVAEIIRGLGNDCGVNAVYLDQIASAPPRVCFDATHGHALGSGPWWVGGYRSLLSPIKQWTTTEGRSIALTSENNAEPYMENIDAHLIWTPRSDDEIPMITAVYSGYTLYYASNRAFAYGDVSYCLCQARDFVWGTQLGWDGAEILAPGHREKLEFLKRLARLRAKALDYFVRGELVEVLAFANEIPSLSGTWNTPKGDGPVTLPAVHGARWTGPDGSVLIVIANADTAPHEVTFAWMGPGRRVERLGTDGMQTLPGMPESESTYSVEVPARDGILLVVR